MEELLGLLSEVVMDVDFENEKNLVTDDVLDSFDIIAIVNELNSHYGIKIEVDHMLPENFDTAEAIYELVMKLKG